MRITLIGMSGSGKSYWSRKLKERNFKRFPCDDLIARQLFPELVKPDNTVRFLGQWMGFPYQPGYEERESRYLAAEIRVLSEIIRYLENSTGGVQESVVVDTTGSVVYCGEEILQGLRRFTTVVHLSTPAELQGKMMKAYLAHPRPVLWKGLFARKQGEAIEQALERCYPILLATREDLYRRYAHMAVDDFKRRSEGFDVDEFLQEIIEKG